MPRRFLDQEGRLLRDEYRLRRWFTSDDGIRIRYFAEIDHIIVTLQTDEGDPPDATVVSMLANMCENDPSFESHVLERSAQNPRWKELRETGAGMAFENYIRERENGTWP